MVNTPVGHLVYSDEMANWRVVLKFLLLAVLLLMCSRAHSSGDFFSRLLSNKGENFMNLARSLDNCISYFLTSVE